MYKIFLTALVTYFIAAAGLFLGGAVDFILPNDKSSPRRTLLSLGGSFTGGMCIALVGFELFPAALASSNLYFGATAIIGGVLIAFLSEERFHANTPRYRESFLYLLTCGIALGLFFVADGAVLSAALIIFLSMIPFGAVIIQDGKSLFGSFVLSGFTAAGGLIGAAATFLPELISSIILSASAGCILYISCGASFTEKVHNKEHGVLRGKKLFSFTALSIGFIFAVILIELF